MRWPWSRPERAISRWKPEYNALSDYNGTRLLAECSNNEETRERNRQIVRGYSPEFVARMKVLQEDYDANFLGKPKPQ